ncbi:MAG: Vitamin B12 dependent methionine synthase activation subunit [Clostridia bacterium]|nr:Vitamin B12 dependent methionine synthase activation subunit [Clostridia bacterium]
MDQLRTMYMVNNRDLKIKIKDVMRYLRVKENDGTMRRLLEECSNCVYESASPKAVYTKVNVKIEKDTVNLGFIKVKSSNLSMHLADCDEAYIIATTLGIGVDRLFEKYNRILQTKAAVCDATASALIESFCDYVNESVVGNREAVMRFSPGYGDFDLKHQKEILDYLDANKKIGISLTDSYMMVPSKSVTAIIGIKREVINDEYTEID